MSDYRIEEHGSDIIVIAPGMTYAKYSDIVASLPAEKARRVIGWKRLAK